MCLNDESTGQFLVYWETLHPSTVGRLWDVLCLTKCQFDEPCANDFHCPQHLLKMMRTNDEDVYTAVSPHNSPPHN